MLPVVNLFYDYLKQGKVMGARCSGCDAISFPPKGLCDHCGSIDFSWVTMSGRGKLMFAGAGLHRKMNAQYMLGTVKFEEGPWVSGMLLDDGFDFSQPERVWDYNGRTDINVVTEIIKNFEGVEAVAFRVVR